MFYRILQFSIKKKVFLTVFSVAREKKTMTKNKKCDFFVSSTLSLTFIWLAVFNSCCKSISLSRELRGHFAWTLRGVNLCLHSVLNIKYMSLYRDQTNRKNRPHRTTTPMRTHWKQWRWWKVEITHQRTQQKKRIIHTTTISLQTTKNFSSISGNDTNPDKSCQVLFIRRGRKSAKKTDMNSQTLKFTSRKTTNEQFFFILRYEHRSVVFLSTNATDF